MRDSAGPFREAVLALTVLSACSSLGAQTAGAVLAGRVISADGNPIEGAHVVVVGAGVATLSGAGGEYQLRGIPAGERVIEAEHIGYHRLRIELRFLTGEAVRRDLQLDLEPIPLSGLEARVRSSRSPALQGFYERRGRGAGHFFTRAEIESLPARSVTDVLRRVPGAELQPVTGRFGTSFHLRFGRATGTAGANLCAVLYYVDGVPFPVAADAGIDGQVPLQDVAALEVYSGSARVPTQFNRSGNARCGVVAIWTRVAESGSGGG